MAVNLDNDETVLLSQVTDAPLSRIENTGPWDPLFSKDGGIVTTSVTLVGGAPGAGKSTMALQLIDRIAASTKREGLYVCWEEAKEEVKSRAQRLKLKNPDLIRLFPMGATTDLGTIFSSRKPCAVVIDSLQGLTPDPAEAVSFCKIFKEFAVSLGSPFVVIDHIVKDGELAGLMDLQHEVDITMLFTQPWGKEDPRRQLSLEKSRMGPTNRIVVLEMTNEGLIEGEDDDDDDDD